MKHCEVLIAGGGIAGLALAAELGLAGVNVALLDGAAAPEPVPAPGDIQDWDQRVSALTPTSQAMLERLGAWQFISSERVAPYRRMQVWDRNGTGEIAFDAAEVGVPQLGYIVENRVTVAALLEVIKPLRTVELHWGCRVESVDDSTDPVSITTNGGETLTASVLVGADGARSAVREKLAMATRQWPYKQHAIVATVALASTHNDCCYQAFLPTGPLALLPLANSTLCSIVWSLDDSVWEPLMSAPDVTFLTELNRALDQRIPEVVAVAGRAAFPLHQCHAVDYVRPRVALVADAAHSIHPLAGQGINLGLKDVAVLASELERAQVRGLGLGDMATLRRYPRQRKADNLALMAAMEGFKRGFGAREPLVHVLRNAGLDWVNRSAPLKKWFMRQALG